MDAAILLEAAKREPQSWKNGGGRTSDVVVFPAGSGIEDFAWRISIADVEADGPFSLFPTVERHIAMLAGTLRLRFDDHEHMISVGDAPFSFSGASPVEGLPIGGPARDLNLMVRSDRYDGRLRVVGPGCFRAGTPVAVIVALGVAALTVNGVEFKLGAEDALLLSGPADVESTSPVVLAELRPIISAPAAAAGHSGDQVPGRLAIPLEGLDEPQQGRLQSDA